MDVRLQAMHCQEAVSMRVMAMPIFVIVRSEATKQSRSCSGLDAACRHRVKPSPQFTLFLADCACDFTSPCLGRRKKSESKMINPAASCGGIEHPSLNSFHGKPRGIEPGGIKVKSDAAIIRFRVFQYLGVTRVNGAIFVELQK